MRQPAASDIIRTGNMTLLLRMRVGKGKLDFGSAAGPVILVRMPIPEVVQKKCPVRKDDAISRALDSFHTQR
jgi:hypothetical protein